MSKLGVLDVCGTKYTLKNGQKYLVGKRSNEYYHDIELDDSTVDIKHCIIDFSQGSLQLTDLYSKHGSFVDGTKVIPIESTPITKTTKIQFGDVETFLQLVTESDSGFLEERVSSPTKDSSEIICNSPENTASSGTRLKHTLKSSYTSTPNNSGPATTPNEQKSAPSFLIPPVVPRKSLGSNTSGKSVDSFFIPETQCPAESSCNKSNTTNVSIASNTSRKNNTAGDDDFFIPETQEVVSNGIHLRDTFSDSDKIPTSQFRICTQDFNGFGDDESNGSDDILANVPCSMVIPIIRHDIVEVKDPSINPEDEEDKEMSELQWSKKTSNEDPEGSATPDDLFAVVGSVTSDLNLDVIKSFQKAPSERSTPDIFSIPDEPEVVPVVETDPVQPEPQNSSRTNSKSNKPEVKSVDLDFQPTQVFERPTSVVDRSVSRPSFLPPDKENVGPEDDISFLPATQVFMPPPKKPNPVTPRSISKAQAPDDDKPSTSPKLAAIAPTHVFLKPQASPKPSPKPRPLLKSPAPVVPEYDDDDLPPTQVFEKIPPPIVPNHCLSSTLVDCDLQQLSETSFKAKCNKLLDSDDDEMDEIVAPDLVKQMRASLDSLKSKVGDLLTSGEPVTQNNSEKLSTPEEPQTSSPNPLVTPENKIFRVPNNAVSRLKECKSAVNIDDFLLTPDFLFQALPKDKQLQKQAEVNWKNMVSEKQRRPLFGDEEVDDCSGNTCADESQDSFDDLLPKRRITRSKSLSKASNERYEQPKEKSKTGVVVKINRRRQSLVPDANAVSKPTSLSKSKRERSKKEPKLKDENKDSKEQEDSKVEKASKGKEENLKVEKSSKELNIRIESNTRNKAKTAEDPLTAENKKEQIPKADKGADHQRDSRKERESKLRKEKRSKSEKETSSKSASNTKEPSMTKESSLISEKSLAKDQNVSKEASTNASDIINREIALKWVASTDLKQHNGSSKEVVLEKTKSRRKEIVEKPSKTKDKPTGEESSSLPSGRSTRRNKKSDNIQVVSEPKPPPRLTRLKSVVDSETVTKKANPKDKPETEKKAGTKLTPPNNVNTSGQTIDLTDSDTEGANKTAAASVKAKKRKSEEDEATNKRTRIIQGSQSSVESSDSGRSLRRKKKIKIASSGGPVIKDKLQRYTGVLWHYIEDPKECDVLILEQGNRTYKLLVALARGIPIVHLNWLTQVLKQKTTDIPFDDYLFEEENFQKRHQFVMRDSLQIARSTSVFRGIEFMMTPNIVPKPEEMKDIIECSGGTVLTDIPKLENGRTIYLVSEQNDKEHWHRYRRVNPNIKITSAKALMTTVMQQSMDALIKSIHQ